MFVHTNVPMTTRFVLVVRVEEKLTASVPVPCEVDSRFRIVENSLSSMKLTPERRRRPYIFKYMYYYNEHTERMTSN